MKTFLLFTAKIIGSFVFKIYFRLEVSGTRNIPKTGPFILAANHTSFLDPPLIGYICPRALHYFARATLFRNKFFGGLIRLLGAFPAEKQLGVSAVRQGLKILSLGQGLLIFPEGTRSRDGKLSSPLPGVGFLALKSGASVVPIYIKGAYQAYPPGARFIKPAKIKVIVGSPVKFTCGDYRTIGKKIMGLIAGLEATTLENGQTKSCLV